MVMQIVIDTREQNPYLFKVIDPPPETVTATLETGDYSIIGFESQITIERKSMVDAYGTFGKGRARFERELVRMARMKYAAVVIEADWHTILRNPPRHSLMQPKTIYRSVIAWEQRYGVHFWACPNRAFAERTTYIILDRFFRDNRDGC
jgi:DNA excision repair protein ERCC-4